MKTTDDPVFEIPQELDPSFHAWKANVDEYSSESDFNGLMSPDGDVAWLGVGGGAYEAKGRGLAAKTGLTGLCIDGRTVPQPLIDAAGELRNLKRLHLGNVGPRSLSPLRALDELRSLYIEGIKGPQEFSVSGMRKLESLAMSGDADAVSTSLAAGNSTVSYLMLGGTASANLRLPSLDVLTRFPKLEYLVLLNVTAANRSLSPCLALKRLRKVIVNFERSWDKQSIEALREAGVPVRFRMDEIIAQMK